MKIWVGKEYFFFEKFFFEIFFRPKKFYFWTPLPFTTTVCNSAYPYVCQKILSGAMNNSPNYPNLRAGPRPMPAPVPRPNPIRPINRNANLGSSVSSTLDFGYDYPAVDRNYPNYPNYPSYPNYGGAASNNRPGAGLGPSGPRPLPGRTPTSVNSLNELKFENSNRRLFDNQPPHTNPEPEGELEESGSAGGAFLIIFFVFASIISLYMGVNFYRGRKKAEIEKREEQAKKIQEKKDKKENEKTKKDDDDSPDILPLAIANSEIYDSPDKKTQTARTIQPPEQPAQPPNPGHLGPNIEATCLEVEINNQEGYMQKPVAAKTQNEEDPAYDTMANRNFSNQFRESTGPNNEYFSQLSSQMRQQHRSQKLPGKENNNARPRNSIQSEIGQSNPDVYDFIPTVKNSARIRYYTYKNKAQDSGSSKQQNKPEPPKAQPAPRPPSPVIDPQNDPSKNEFMMTNRDLNRVITCESIPEYGPMSLGNAQTHRQAPARPTNTSSFADHRGLTNHNYQTSIKKDPSKPTALGSTYWNQISYGELNPHKPVDYTKSLQPESNQLGQGSGKDNSFSQRYSMKAEPGAVKLGRDSPEMMELTERFNSMTRPVRAAFYGNDEAKNQNPLDLKIIDPTKHQLHLTRNTTEQTLEAHESASYSKSSSNQPTILQDTKKLQIFIENQPKFDLKNNFNDNILSYNANFDFGIDTIEKDLAGFRAVSKLNGGKYPLGNAYTGHEKSAEGNETDDPSVTVQEPIKPIVPVASLKPPTHPAPPPPVQNVHTNVTKESHGKFPKPSSLKNNAKTSDSDLSLENIPIPAIASSSGSSVLNEKNKNENFKKRNLIKTNSKTSVSDMIGNIEGKGVNNIGKDILKLKKSSDSILE